MAKNFNSRDEDSAEFDGIHSRQGNQREGAMKVDRRERTNLDDCYSSSDDSEERAESCGHGSMVELSDRLRERKEAVLTSPCRTRSSLRKPKREESSKEAGNISMHIKRHTEQAETCAENRATRIPKNRTRPGPPG